MDAAERDRHVAAIVEHGYTIVRRVWTEARAREALDAVRDLERTLGITPASNVFEGARTLRIYNLLVHGEIFRSIPTDEVVLPIVERILDRGCLVSSLSSIDIQPGEGAQPLHADDQVIPLPRPHVPIVCNSMWALTDFTEANGATRVVPGSHRFDGFPPYDGTEVPTLPAEMEAGSVLVYDGSLWHGGGANRTGEARCGIAMNYCAGWIRQQENQQLGIPLALARTFSPRLRRLCGFGLYRRLIGHIDRCSPEDLLDESGPRPVVGFVP